MANNFITMTQLRTIIRLYENRTGIKTISRMSRTSRNTVKKYIHTWNSLKMSFEEFQSKSDTELHSLFCVSGALSRSNPRRETLEGLLPEISKALGRKGMTVRKQWQKYIKDHPDGYGLTLFRVAIQRYRLINNPSMRMEHKAGDKLFVDYTGDKLWIYPQGEAPHQVDVFVAILGCTLLTYVEAVAGQTKEDFISACENAFYFYGGVPQAIVPDNLKAAVTKASRVESTLNEEFGRFAEHYAVTVFPARVRKPRDKAPVENAVKLTYKDIFTNIEHLHCPDLKSLNAAIRSALEVHNNKLLTNRNYSRRSYFEEIEREYLGALTPIRYQIKKHVMATSIELSGYSAAIQQEVYETCYRESDSPASWANIGRKELAARLIRRYTMTLDDYGFDKAECRTCQYNTDTNTLFDECRGRCTNLECLRGKQRQYTLDICKERVGEADFEVIVSPADRLNPDMAEKLKEEGIEVKTFVSHESPEPPQKPKRENFKLECDYRDALDKYKLEDLEYNSEMDEYEKRVENGEYRRCLHIGGGNPKICYVPVKKESGEKTIKELEDRAKANYETARNNIIKASLDLIRSREIVSTAFSVLEEEIFLYLMLGYVDKKRFPLFGVTDQDRSSLADKDKETVISRITGEQYGLLKREFILKCILQVNTGKLSPKFQIYLQSFAQQHFPEEAEDIVMKQLDIYSKSKEKIDREIQKLKTKPAIPAEY